METIETTSISAAAAVIAVILGAFVTYKLNNKRINDKKLFRFYQKVFDRPAFKGPHNMHSNQKEFKEAFRILISAVNTGVLTNRKGLVLDKAKSKSEIKNTELRSAMNEVELSLKSIEMIIPDSLPVDPEIGKTIDSEWDSKIKLMNKIWRSFGEYDLQIPSEIGDIQDIYHE